jgi:endonuclease-3
MAQVNRSGLLTRLHKVLRKHFKPIPPSGQAVLEQLLFACCLENARYDAAEQAYAAISTSFFDWNEVRVSSVKELAEMMRVLPDATAAASTLKQSLQSAFEATYSFDLEALKKQNLGQAIQRLKRFKGTTPFTVAFVTQAALGGHSIPLDRGALYTLYIVGAASEAEVKAAEVSGLERAIPKNKGVEFGSLLHQLGAELVASPLSPAVQKILLEVAPDAKDRLPKRHPKKPPRAAEAPPPAAAAKGTSAAAKKPDTSAKGREEIKKKSTAKASAVSKKVKTGAKKKSEAAKLAKRKPR